MKELITNHFNPKPVILVQLRDPTHHMLFLNEWLSIWFVILHLKQFRKSCGSFVYKLSK